MNYYNNNNSWAPPPAGYQAGYNYQQQSPVPQPQPQPYGNRPPQPLLAHPQPLHHSLPPQPLQQHQQPLPPLPQQQQGPSYSHTNPYSPPMTVAHSNSNSTPNLMNQGGPRNLPPPSASSSSSSSPSSFAQPMTNSTSNNNNNNSSSLHHSNSNSSANSNSSGLRTTSRSSNLNIMELFPELQTQSCEQLEALLADEAAIQAYFIKIPTIINAKKAKEELLLSNAELARKTLALEPGLLEKREKVLAAHTELSKKRQEYDALYQKQQDILNRFNGEMVLDRLRVAISDSDEKSEAMIEGLMSGEKSLDDFIKDYQNIRRLYHERTAKAEKLQHLLDRR